MFLFCGSPRCIRGICGGAPERGRPCTISHCAIYIFDDTYKRVLMLQAPQRRKQPWFQHVVMYGEGCGAPRGSDAHRIGKTKCRCQLFCGARVNFLFHIPLPVSRISHAFDNEEVQDQRYVPSSHAQYTTANKYKILTPSLYSTLRRVPAKTSAPMPRFQTSKTTMPGANTTLPLERAS
jgi:hypothetical protein